MQNAHVMRRVSDLVEYSTDRTIPGQKDNHSIYIAINVAAGKDMAIFGSSSK